MTVKSWGYARQKFWEAVSILVSDADIKDRLAHAQNLLAILQADRDLPDRLQPRFRKLMNELSKRTISYSYRPNRVNARHPKARKMASEIFDMYIDLRGGI